jgi:hypothetical protein
LPSTWWCSSGSVSTGVFFFDLFCGGIVSCFPAETRWAPMLGVRKIGGSPRTQRFITQIAQVTKVATRRQWIFESMRSPQKLWIPLHMPLRPLL